MKKILSLVLSLMMVLASVSAMAEAVLDFDFGVTETVPGEFIGLEGLGLMFYVPETMQMLELTEAAIATGGLAAFSDGSLNASVAYAPVFDDAGNPLLDLDSIIACYAAAGLNAAPIILNNVNAVVFTMPGSELCGVVYPDGEGGILAFTFSNSGDTASIMMSSIMPYAE